MVYEIKKETFKDLVDRLMKLKGEARGACLKSDMEFLLKEKGKEGLKQMEEELERLGCPIKYKKIKTGGFYSIGQDVLDILVIWKLFDFDKEKIKQMGYEAANFSIFTKLYLKYLSSPEKTLTQNVAMDIWRNHYSVGDVTVLDVDEEKKHIILRFDNFDIHPILCLALEGYFAKVCQMVSGKKATCSETKCTFCGDKCHKFVGKW